jgi:tetratricopeptide (TPR) repeat protein
VQAAPADLVVSIMAAGIDKGTAAQGVSLALMKSTLKIMTWMKIKAAIAVSVSALLIAGAATSVVAQMGKTSHTSPPAPPTAPASPSPSTSQFEPRRASVLDKQVAADPATVAQGGSAADDAQSPDAAADPQDAPSFIKRGRAYLDRNDYDKAIADFNHALLFAPKSPAAYFNLGRANKLKGDYPQALADYTQAIQLNPKMVAAYVNRGQIENMAEHYNDAIDDFDHAIALAPERPIPYLNRGVAYGGKGEYDKAKADFASVIALAPDFSPAYNNLAWQEATCSQVAFRDGKDAVQNATKACQLSQWQNINQIDTLAAASAEAGDFANAIKWETQVMQSSDLAPEDVTTARERLSLYQTRQTYHRPPPAAAGMNP